MAISKFLSNLVSCLSEENYEKKVSNYQLWMKIGLTHGWVPDNQLHNDIWENMRPDLVYPSSSQLIHPTTHLLVKFITDVEPNPGSPTLAQLCRSSLKGFFDDNSDFDPRTKFQNDDWVRFNTNANLLAHLVNGGYLNLEDVRDHILQSLIYRPIPWLYQLRSLVILLKIAGAAFAAYVDPSVMDRCLHVLKSGDLKHPAITTLAKVRSLCPSAKTGNKCRENRRL